MVAAKRRFRLAKEGSRQGPLGTVADHCLFTIMHLRSAYLTAVLTRYGHDG